MVIGPLTGVGAMLAVQWWFRRRKLIGHWVALDAEAKFSKGLAETFLADRYAAPLYRLPLSAYQFGIPVLLADGGFQANQELTDEFLDGRDGLPIRRHAGTGLGFGLTTCMRLGARTAYLQQALRDKLIEHKHYVREHGDDMPDIAGWRWGQHEKTGGRATDTAGDNV